ncbi:hypothetical protein JD844_019457 [Phrynosoma platyrhinos]|uniref:Fibronectin type-III domain-containing protein n=1 Tax=Phrynosoma platyrhinos TaxID=52577 RepID=A0ABQ7TPI8_PHRPL|nr:hypothetical protein JD844_019457 [Phrynosoma platyrhinos]
MGEATGPSTLQLICRAPQIIKAAPDQDQVGTELKRRSSCTRPVCPTGSLLCPLSASPEAQDHYSCSVEGEGEFTENDDYSVSLHAANASLGKNRAYPVFTSYEPRLHIQCDPPTCLQSNASASKCRIQWRKPKAYEDINLEDWHWQLAFKAAGEPWERAETRSFVNQDSWVEIDGSELKGGVDYVARVRCKIPEENNDYHSHWSTWSATTSWTAPAGTILTSLLPEKLQSPTCSLPILVRGCSWHREEQKMAAHARLLLLTRDDAGQKQLDPRLPRALQASLPLCLGALLFLFLAFVWRMKDRGGTHIPTPATFFQPLYTSHNGDFKVTAAIGWGAVV